MRLFKLWGENYMKTPQLFRSVNPTTQPLVRVRTLCGIQVTGYAM